MQKVLPGLDEGHAPIALQNAFHDAVEALEDWVDGEEPEVRIEGAHYPISMIFTHMRACTDLLPHRTRDTIETIVDRNVLRSGAGLYADGARIVLPLCDERLERLQQAPAPVGMALSQSCI
ncbi:hypothetical protein [Mesorhizobium sp. SP-1A]|uniref:hypothetical protein n=1 Tax=Mesorhizobium sp. SP-1A TaxID=3077840 RepID=UPI0028F6E6E2|nr:hypothetical protein [Mesorhizobium sp. SP-1A]